PWFDLIGLAFVDVGQVWAERADFGRDLAKSVGLGLRATTPVGVVRLDLARPLDRRPGDPSFKAYIGLGSAF
ncbi:MAG: BamA/TamA family outer membrane protein, partial [Holophagae bacterium]|nr:BamA/TamA family outer membrane protein [Holophagae bacterium]